MWDTKIWYGMIFIKQKNNYTMGIGVLKQVPLQKY